MKKTLLIMTVGGTDVQICVDGQRKELAAKLYPELSKLVETDNGWTVGDAPVEDKKDKKDKKDKEQKENRQDTLPTDSITFCAPKLDAVLRHASSSDLSIESVLILDTRRQPTGTAQGKGHAKDPSHAGPVLARRLKNKLGIDARFGTHLTGDETYEDPSDPPDPRDAVIRREVVTRIDTACRQAIEQAKPQVILLAVGAAGVPAVRSLVPEIIRLRASDEVEIRQLDIPDARLSGSNGADRAVLIPEMLRPDDLFAARRHALRLVRRGHLLGAFGAVAHIHKKAAQETWTEITSWTRVLEWLADWASSLPLPTCEIDLLTYSGPGKRAVRSALQVELALRAGNIPSAVHGTVAFFESALWDHLLDKVLTQHPTDGKRYAFKAPPSAKVAFPFKESPDESGTLYYKVDTSKGGCTKLVTAYLNEPALLRLHQAISGMDENSPSPVRDLRNDVAHNIPTEEKMEEAKQVMRTAKLWSGHNPPQFLCQDLVKNVLTELGIAVAGVANPAKLCEKLISDVEQRILVPS